MISTKVFCQSDWRWWFKKVGFGKGNFRSVGCTTTSLTSLLFIAGYDLTPPQVAERLRAVGGYTGDLIIWSKIEKAFPNVRFHWRSYKYDNDEVKRYVNLDIPVLVEVMTKYGKHWCTFLGDMKMIDPINGRVVMTSKYNPIGYSLIKIKKNNKWIPIN